MVKTIIIEEKDILADFSSRGPVTSTWEIKPDVLAPGVAINSTIPGGYLSTSRNQYGCAACSRGYALSLNKHIQIGDHSKLKRHSMNYAKAPSTPVRGIVQNL